MGPDPAPRRHLIKGCLGVDQRAAVQSPSQQKRAPWWHQIGWRLGDGQPLRHRLTLKPLTQCPLCPMSSLQDRLERFWVPTLPFLLGRGRHAQLQVLAEIELSSKRVGGEERNRKRDRDRFLFSTFWKLL